MRVCEFDLKHVIFEIKINIRINLLSTYRVKVGFVNRKAGFDDQGSWQPKEVDSSAVFVNQKAWIVKWRISIKLRQPSTTDSSSKVLQTKKLDLSMNAHQPRTTRFAKDKEKAASWPNKLTRAVTTFTVVRNNSKDLRSSGFKDEGRRRQLQCPRMILGFYVLVYVIHLFFLLTSYGFSRAFQCCWFHLTFHKGALSQQSFQRFGLFTACTSQAAPSHER